MSAEIESVSRFDTLLVGPCLEPCQASNIELLVKDSILDDWLRFEYIYKRYMKGNAQNKESLHLHT